MLNKWRDELEAGRQKAQVALADVSSDMLDLVYRLARATFLVGIAVGVVAGGFLVWLIK